MREMEKQEIRKVFKKVLEKPKDERIKFYCQVIENIREFFGIELEDIKTLESCPLCKRSF
jgi:rubrerythrin